MCQFSKTDGTVTYGKNMFHGRIIDAFSMVTIDSTTTSNCASTSVLVLKIWRMIVGITQTFTLIK